MSIADVKYLNLLVHFGPQNEYNLKELMEQSLITILGSQQVITLPTSRTQQLRELEFFDIDKKIYITGLMYKSGSLNWESIPDPNEDPTLSPGQQAIMPYARFILSVGDHRLFWITKRGLTKSPTPVDFCNFLKRVTVFDLRKRYEEQAKIIWEEENPRYAGHEHLPMAVRKELQSFVKKHLEFFRVTMDLMEIRVVAETSIQLAIQVINDPKYVITNATLIPHMNNVTADDCEELFTKADKLAKESEGDVTVNLKADDNKVGLKKKALESLLEINEQKNLLQYKLKLKEKENSRAKPLIVSNMELKTDEKALSASVSKHATSEIEPKDIAIVSSLMFHHPDMYAHTDTDDTIREMISAQLKKIK